MADFSENDGKTTLEMENHRLRQALADAHRRIDALERLADEDVLISVLNRRAFVRELGRALATKARYGVGGALIYLDLDGFKAVNDRHGHDIGDMVLKHVGELIMAHIRQSDLAGRLGGDEFGIFLNRAPLEDALVKAEALCRLIAETAFLANGAVVAPAASYGVVALDNRYDAEGNLARADHEMYCRKKQKTPAATARRKA